MHLVLALLGALRAALGARTDLVLENLALRQQLALLRRRSKRPRFGPLDRLFWIWLSQRWARWRETLNVVRPETVIRWHRQSAMRPRHHFVCPTRRLPADPHCKTISPAQTPRRRPTPATRSAP